MPPRLVVVAASLCLAVGISGRRERVWRRTWSRLICAVRSRITNGFVAHILARVGSTLLWSPERFPRSGRGRSVQQGGHGPAPARELASDRSSGPALPPRRLGTASDHFSTLPPTRGPQGRTAAPPLGGTAISTGACCRLPAPGPWWRANQSRAPPGAGTRGPQASTPQRSPSCAAIGPPRHRSAWSPGTCGETTRSTSSSLSQAPPSTRIPPARSCRGSAPRQGFPHSVSRPASHPRHDPVERRRAGPRDRRPPGPRGCHHHTLKVHAKVLQDRASGLGDAFAAAVGGVT